jgi:hypothetical protein
MSWLKRLWAAWTNRVPLWVYRGEQRCDVLCPALAAPPDFWIPSTSETHATCRRFGAVVTWRDEVDGFRRCGECLHKWPPKE